MKSLWLYSWMSGAARINYRAKIMLMAFAGTHVPLIALIVFYIWRTDGDFHSEIVTILVALVATLIGTGVTLFVLTHLLRPVIATSKALAAYRDRRELLALPTQFTDEAGMLMADASHTLSQLDASLMALQFVDGTTGLNNRDRFTADLTAQSQLGNRLAIGVLSLANYGRIVTTFGQQTGDSVIAQLAARVTEHLGPATTLARVRLDAIAFYSADADDLTNNFAAMSRKMAQALSLMGADLTIGDATIKPETAGGVAVYPDDGGDAVALLDMALSAAASADADGTPAFHSPALRLAARQRFDLEHQLRLALERDEFELHYQPVIDMDLGRAVGAEALIRWNHPTRGLLAPGHFIAAAEAAGLMEPMGLWVMRRACEQVRDWNASGMGELTVAINLSAPQFRDLRLVDRVDRAVRSAGIGAHQLELELTETAAMADHERTRGIVNQLRQLGVSLSIDDFGTGYASMSQLRHLQFQKLKIDREFVSDVDTARNSQAICSALIALAGGMGLKLVAEGTETAEEVAHLHAMGCRLFQGYYFARPVPASAFAEAIADAALVAATLKSTMLAPPFAKAS